jgi:hypothetical protein
MTIYTDAYEALTAIRDRQSPLFEAETEKQARLIIEEQRMLLEDAVSVINELRHSKRSAGLQAVGWKRRYQEHKQRVGS